jgi:branched-chain amino acid transport system substrate-binding protein
MKQVVRTIILALLCLCCPSWLFATDAPNRDEIRLGMSTVLSGPATNLGTDMRQGVLAGLERTNRTSGIHAPKNSKV